MKKFLRIVVLGLFLAGSSYASEENTVTIDTTKVKDFFETFSGKTLKKDDIIKFLNEYAIIIEDERGNGVVTYIFDEENYKRYKDFKVISDDAWRFTNTGQLRLFNANIKLTWKIILNKENKISIKAKYAPFAKFYSFVYEPKADYLTKLEDVYNKEIAEKEREKQKKLEAQKKLEQETLETQKKLEQEILETQKKLEQEILYNKLEPQFRKKCKKTIFNDLYKIGTSEYRECILYKGPENMINK